MSFSKSRNWSAKEDEDLLNALESTKTQPKGPTWNQIAQMMRFRNPSCRKTGKQCRERWANQLNPIIKRNESWSIEENLILFQLHEQMGNKWSEIANKIPGRTDNCVKNHFYSTMRRGLRKINSYIENIKRKTCLAKTFKTQTLMKILAISEGKNECKYKYSSTAKQLSTSIKSGLIQLTLEKEEEDEKNMEYKEKIFQQISQFSRNCRKKKSKKLNDINEDSICQVQQKQQKLAIPDRQKIALEPEPQISSIPNKPPQPASNITEVMPIRKIPLMQVHRTIDSLPIQQMPLKNEAGQKCQNFDISLSHMNPFSFYVGNNLQCFTFPKNEDRVQPLQTSFLSEMPEFNKVTEEKPKNCSSGFVNFMGSGNHFSIYEHPIMDNSLSHFSEMMRSQIHNQTYNFRDSQNNYNSTSEGSGIASGVFSYSPAHSGYGPFTFCNLAPMWNIPEEREPVKETKDERVDFMESLKIPNDEKMMNEKDQHGKS